jgi:hypothetical protein
MRFLNGTEVLFVWSVSCIWLNQMAQWETIPAGCSKRLPRKAAGESKPEAYPSSPARPELPRQLVSRVGYVEDFDEPRTKLADFFSILLESGHTYA